MLPTPTPEHLWLKRLAGTWSFESACPASPGEEPARAEGVETIRMVGDVWLVAESTGTMPGGAPMTAIMTLGFDPARNAFVGTWIGSPMTHMFVYQGTLDDERSTLTLNTTGPDFNNPGASADYRDIIEWRSNTERRLRSEMKSDGAWHEIMHATYRRTT